MIAPHRLRHLACLGLLSLFFAGCSKEAAKHSLNDSSPVGNEPGVTESVTDLIRSDFAQRSRTGNLPITPLSKEQIERLEARVCPIDGTELVVVELPASRTYTDISNDAYYCPVHRVYWVKHTQGAFMGNVSVWRGPFGPLP